MRLFAVLLCSCLLLSAIGCMYDNQTAAASGGAPSLERVPVGPIPGVPVLHPAKVDPYAENPVALSEGRRLFVQYNCSGCHGGRAGGGMGPSLRDKWWIYGNSDAHVFDSIAQGRGRGMPAWGTKIPTDQIWKLTAYVKSLRTPLEPEPPEK